MYRIIKIIYTIIRSLRTLSVFANCRSQLLLDSLGRCLQLFVSSDSTFCHEFTSQFGLAFFYMRKTSKTSLKSGRQHVCLYEWPATGIVWPASKTGVLGRTDTANSDGRGWVCACVRACVRNVFAIYGNDILPRLIMIIIKIIILYFIQIRHTDDFPSTGTRLVNVNHKKIIILAIEIKSSMHL